MYSVDMAEVNFMSTQMIQFLVSKGNLMCIIGIETLVEFFFYFVQFLFSGCILCIIYLGIHFSVKKSKILRNSFIKCICFLQFHRNKAISFYRSLSFSLHEHTRGLLPTQTYKLSISLSNTHICTYTKHSNAF